jgi:quercetin dioxygenase-like cupin family protein
MSKVGIVPKVIKSEGGKTLNVLGDPVMIKLRGDETGGAFSQIIAGAEPNCGPPLHVHHNEDETFYVLEGELEIRIGDQLHVGTPGTLVFGPRNIPHTFRNVGQAPAKMLVTLVPAGFERFFEEVHELGTAGPPPVDQVVALGRTYNLDFLL